MTRDEAIGYFYGLASAVASEFATSRSEEAEMAAECERAFDALGVSTEERS